MCAGGRRSLNSWLLTSTPGRDHRGTQHQRGSWIVDGLSSEFLVKCHPPGSIVPCQHVAGGCWNRNRDKRVCSNAACFSKFSSRASSSKKVSRTSQLARTLSLLCFCPYPQTVRPPYPAWQAFPSTSYLSG